MEKDKIEKIFKEIKEKVDKKIIEILDLKVDKKIRKILNYQIQTGGKRIRPILCILSCKAVGGREKDALFASAGIEILHNFSLIIDDIIDHSILRRNKETLWAKYGKSIAQCLAMSYSAAVFQSASLTKKPKEISLLFAEAIKKIVEGEILDILFEQKGREDERYIIENRFSEVSLRDYLEMVSKKTAFLFKITCKVGAILGEGLEKEIKALEEFGFNLGIAFQIKDDILDIFGKEEIFGKEIGKDIKERKMGNIVLLLSFKELKEKERKSIKRILKKDKILKKDIKEAIDLIKKTKALEKAEKLGEKYVKEAMKRLSLLEKNKSVKLLREIADFLQKREK